MFTWNELKPKQESASLVWREIPAPTLYDELSLTSSATAEQIRQAFRRRALQLHPDHSPGSDTHHAMARLNEVYRILGSAQRRKAYDQQR